MAGHWRLLLVCLVAMTTVTAVPHTKRTDNCMEAGELADTLFHQMVSKYRPYFNIPEMFSEVLDMDYDTFTFTEIICLLEGVESVDGAMDRLYYSPDRLALNIFKGIYDYIVVGMRFSKGYMLYNQEHYQSESVSDELDLIRALEASNITKLDPKGVAWMTEAIRSVEPGGNNLPEPEPMSTKPVRQQCRDITNIVRKIWNKMIKNGPYDELAGVYHREQLYNTTGIYIPQGPQTHEMMFDVVCGTIGSSIDLDTLYAFLFYERIIGFLVSEEYRRAASNLKMKYMYDNYNDYGNYYGNNYGDDLGYFALKENLELLVGMLNDMGLLDLQLMLDMYPYPGQPFVNPYDYDSYYNKF